MGVGDIGIRAFHPARQIGAHEKVEDAIDAVGRHALAARLPDMFGDVVGRGRARLRDERGEDIGAHPGPLFAGNGQRLARCIDQPFAGIVVMMMVPAHGLSDRDEPLLMQTGFGPIRAQIPRASGTRDSGSARSRSQRDRRHRGRHRGSGAGRCGRRGCGQRQSAGLAHHGHAHTHGSDHETDEERAEKSLRNRPMTTTCPIFSCKQLRFSRLRSRPYLASLAIAPTYRRSVLIYR
jgi:hypothetical protein